MWHGDPARHIFLSTLSMRRATGSSICGSSRKIQFLSTLSMRRATRPQRIHRRGKGFLSTLSMRRATQHISDGFPFLQISIHALHAESDFWASHQMADGVKFLSTLSMRRATPSTPWRMSLLSDFYPRSPCGERRESIAFLVIFPEFLSTLSMRRATAKGYKKCLTFCLLCPNSRMKDIFIFLICNKFFFSVCFTAKAGCEASGISMTDTASHRPG